MERIYSELEYLREDENDGFYGIYEESDESTLRPVDERIKKSIFQTGEKSKEQSKGRSYTEGKVLSQYIVDASRYPLLTPGQERRVSTLMRMYRKNKRMYRYALRSAKKDFCIDSKRVSRIQALYRGCEEKQKAYREKLIHANLRFVIKIAREHLGKGVLFTDLIQEGNLGLIRAVDKFDPTTGNRFTTYAKWWILNKIMGRIIGGSKMIKIPYYILEQYNKVWDRVDAFREEYGRNPLIAEVVSGTKLRPAAVKTILELNKKEFSLDRKLSTGGDGGTPPSFIDFLSDDTAFADGDSIHADLVKKMNEALSILPERDRDMLKMRFGIGYPRTYVLEEIGEKYGLTRERIRQIEKQAIEKIRMDERMMRHLRIQYES